MQNDLQSTNRLPTPLIGDALREAINEQANHELFAALSYRAMSFWCADHDYNGFARFFAQQADEENEHAEKFFRFLLDRDVQPEVGALEAPRNDFGSLVVVAQKAKELERLNTEKIKACYKLAVDAAEHEALPLLLWFLNEQVEEEAWTHTMVTLTRRAECAGAQYGLDRHIIKDLRSDE